jgi:hypothetical protein
MATEKPKRTVAARPKSSLKKTDVPGIYKTRDGAFVDVNGVDMDFKSIKKRDDDRHREVLGTTVTQPADLLKSVALDPRNSMHVRIDAATKAAPYFTPKLVAMQGVAGAAPIGMQMLGGMTQAQLDQYESLLKQAAELANG